MSDDEVRWPRDLRNLESVATTLLEQYQERLRILAVRTAATERLAAETLKRLQMDNRAILLELERLERDNRSLLT